MSVETERSTGCTTRAPARKPKQLCLCPAGGTTTRAPTAEGLGIPALVERLDALDAENQRLRRQIADTQIGAAVAIAVLAGHLKAEALDWASLVATFRSDVVALVGPVGEGATNLLSVLLAALQGVEEANASH